MGLFFVVLKPHKQKKVIEEIVSSTAPETNAAYTGQQCKFKCVR